MKKFFVKCLILACLLTLFLPTVGVYADAQANNKSVLVITNYAKIYKNLSLNASDIFEEENILLNAQYESELTIVPQTFQQGADEFIISIDSYKFYQVDIQKYNQSNATEYAEQFGYVLKTQVMDSSSQSPALKLDTNASIKKGGADIYEYNAELNTYKKSESFSALAQGTKIKLIDGIDYSKPCTRIQFSDENNHVYTVFVKTNKIAVSKISVSVICAVIILFVSIMILLVLFGVKKRKNNLEKVVKKIME